MEVLDNMPKSKQQTIEFRSYDLPEYFPVLLLSGEQWRISDIPSGTLHFHNCLEIGLCETDSGTMEFMGEKRSFHAGDVTIVANNISHTTYSDPGCASKWSYIFVDIQSLLEPLFPLSALEHSAELNKMIHNYYGILPRSEYPDIYNLVTAAICELRRKGSNYEFSVRGLLMALIVKLFPIYKEYELTASEHPHENALVIAPAIDYIQEHYMEDFVMEDLAAMCSLSPTHFRRLFTAIVGDGPLRYLNHIRVQKASVLLRTTEMPILNISDEVGFHSLSSFNRHFLEDFGEAPRDWRKKVVATQSRSIMKFAGWMVPPSVRQGAR
ncbi:AraC family transcriptional regulator [Butyrivibrio fibrisolvens]|jgi:AraC-like DNA-binding protein|uniref:AraC family transcriptional regulator n=2 Tax=Butyrivibrio fibrisolvens TaxID=831 RepID=A0A317G0K9_BUTFI|nr:AraC family transcriptional regulator [Butyrivibrio fibrisolvens]